MRAKALHTSCHRHGTAIDQFIDITSIVLLMPLNEQTCACMLDRLPQQPINMFHRENSFSVANKSEHNRNGSNSGCCVEAEHLAIKTHGDFSFCYIGCQSTFAPSCFLSFTNAHSMLLPSSECVWANNNNNNNS